jgi:hypothetical protein
MKRVFTFGLMVAALSAAPLFAQGQGKGVGVGVGGGGRGTASVQVPGAKVGVKTDTDVQVKGADKVKDVGQSQSTKHESKTVDVGSRIESNTALAAKLKPLLPEDTTLSQASAGFKNQGQFIAALHVAQNLNVPFDQLKARMTGTESMSLGAAIHAVKPELTQTQANTEAKKAEKEAKETERTDKK